MLRKLFFLPNLRLKLPQYTKLVQKPYRIIGLTAGTLFAISQIDKLFKLEQQSSSSNIPKPSTELLETPVTGKYKPCNKCFKNIIRKILRMVELFVIFLPTIILFPFRFFKFTEGIWYNAFAWSVQKAGIVWIKCFQYLSHRRDIVGEELANRFIYLRQKSPAHDIQITEQIFIKEFGKPISQMFDNFDPIPIGVGSVGQVYKAIYKGQKVAVKVRHPYVQKNVENDIDIIFSVSNMLSKISSFFQIPVTNQSLKALLVNQIDFNIQAQNLIKFNTQFKNSRIVRFPNPILSKEEILIEQYIQGVPIEYFEKHKTQFNKQIARYGAEIFFQMLMDHNFIHADLHAGNIYVQMLNQSKTTFDKLQDKVLSAREWVQEKYLSYFGNNDQIKELYDENIIETQEIRRVQSKYNKRAKIILFDVGMVLELADIQRQNFTKFVLSVVLKKPSISSQMIYNLSLYKGRVLRDLPVTKEFTQYKKSLYQLFQRLALIKIKDLQGITLLKGMLDVIRDHKMSLQGQFATLLTNILIVQQIGRDINPQINILKCTVPYFKNVDLKI